MTDNVNPPVAIASSTKALAATLDLELPIYNPPSTHQVVDLSLGSAVSVMSQSQQSLSGNGDSKDTVPVPLIQDSRPRPTSFGHSSIVNESRCPSLESCDSVKKQGQMESTVELSSYGSLDNNSAICNSTGDLDGMQEESIIVKTKCLEKVNGLTHTHILGDRSSSNGIIKTLLPDCCSDRSRSSTQSVTETCDSGQGSKNTCQCNGNDCDEDSCDNVELLKEHSQEVHKESVKSDVEILLHQLEKTSFSHDFSSNVIDGITYMVYESEKQMPDIMKLITKDLSEPYSIYTYRYFIHNWPKLCFLAIADEKCVGAIVCKLDLHKKMVRRGYIAMLAVDSEYRRRQIGSTLVTKAIQAMIGDDCDEVVLETEITNQGALHLYENLGFVRDKRLFRYYLNGVDALRLKLWLR